MWGRSTAAQWWRGAYGNRRPSSAGVLHRDAASLPDRGREDGRLALRRNPGREPFDFFKDAHVHQPVRQRQVEERRPLCLCELTDLPGNGGAGLPDLRGRAEREISVQNRAENRHPVDLAGRVLSRRIA